MKIRRYLFLLLLSQLGLLPFIHAQAELTSELEIQLSDATQDYLPIALLLEDRVDVAVLHNRWTAAGVGQVERVQTLLPQLQLKAKVTQAPLLDYLLNHPGLRPGTLSSVWVVNMVFLEAAPTLVRELAQRPDIAWMGVDHLPEVSKTKQPQEASLLPFDQTRESSLETIHATDMWRLGYTGYGRRALIIDTGEEMEHPALRCQYRGQWATDRESWSGFSGEPVPCSEEEGGLSDHGTHVTGTICGLDRLTEDTIGVAFDAQWLGGGVRLQGCDGYSSGGVRSILETFEWALDPDGNPNTVIDMPDVINNSWNSPPTSDCSESPYIDLAYTMNAAGIAVVFSASNRGPDPSTIGSPAGLGLDLVTIFCVANINARQSHFPINESSSRGPTLCEVSDSSLQIKPEVGAPGTNIRSAVSGGRYSSFSGTSMAAPHVSGAVLLLKEAFPELLGVELLEALYFTCTDLGEPGEDNVFGQGMINVRAAYDYLVAAGHTPRPPTTREHELIALDLATDILNCDQQFTFNFYVENGSPDTVRNLEVYFELDDPSQTNGTFPWTGELLPGERQWITSPSLPAARGSYRLTARAALPNGQADPRFLNNQLRTRLRVIDEASPDVELSNTVSCTGSRTVLRVSNTAPNDVVNWYASPADTLLAVGPAFLTPVLTDTTSFQAQVVRQRSVGLALSDNTATYVDNDLVGGIRFDCHYPITLHSFTIKAEEGGGRIIRLMNKDGRVMKNRIVSIPGPGEYEIDFGINIPVGEDYLLEHTGGRGLYLQRTGIDYPVEYGPVITLTGSAGENIPSRAYCHFYNWQISYADYCGPIDLTITPDSAAVETPSTFFEPSSRELVMGIQDTVYFENRSEGALAYRWDFGDGEMSTEDNPGHQYSTPGTYFVTLVGTSAAGCESAWLDTIHVRMDETVATRDIQQGATPLHLFPNPTRGQLYLELPTDIPTGGLLRLLDLNGRTLQQQAWDTVRESLNLSKLPAGVYLLRYEQDGQTVMGRVIKQ